MADGVSFTLEGADELIAKFAEVSGDVRRKGGRAALRRAAQIVQKAAIANAKSIDDSGTDADISQNIGLRWNGRLFKRTGDLGFRVGVIGGARIPKSKPKGTAEGGPGGDTRYWAFVEFGTERSASRPFMRRALADNVTQVTETFVREYGRALDRAIKRARKRSSSR